MNREPERHVVRREDGLYLEPVNPPEDRVATFFKDLERGLAALDPGPVLAAEAQRANELARLKARREAERVAREQAVVDELAAVRRAVHRAEEREAAADQRAEAAEERAARSERRERFSVKVAVASFVVGCIGTAAAIIAIVG